MDTALLLQLLFRWMHMLAAILAVGGLFYMRLALIPSVQVLTEDQQVKLRDALRSNWARWVHLSIAFLLISGLYNFFFVVLAKKDVHPAIYHSLFTLKILLALAIFAISSILVGSSKTATRFREKSRFWVTLNASLALVVVLISGGLRVSHGTWSKPAPTVVAAP